MGSFYSTTPTCALQVLCGEPPLWIVANELWYTRENDWEKMRIGRAIESRRVLPHERREMVTEDDWNDERTLTVWVDAAVSNKREGSGMAVKDTLGRVSVKGRMNGINRTIYQAELGAIADGVKEAIDRVEPGGRAQIVTDAKAATIGLMDYKSVERDVVGIQDAIITAGLGGKEISVRWQSYTGRADLGKLAHVEARMRMRRALESEWNETEWKRKNVAKAERMKRVMDRWQEEWEMGEKGRTTFGICQWVGNELIGLSKKGAQLATGHGNFLAYLKRFRRGGVVDDACTCGMNESEDVRHALLGCTKESRVLARQEVLEGKGDLTFQLRMGMNRNHNGDIEWWNRLADGAVEDEEI